MMYSIYLDGSHTRKPIQCQKRPIEERKFLGIEPTLEVPTQQKKPKGRKGNSVHFHRVSFPVAVDKGRAEERKEELNLGEREREMASLSLSCLALPSKLRNSLSLSVPSSSSAPSSSSSSQSRSLSFSTSLSHSAFSKGKWSIQTLFSPSESAFYPFYFLMYSQFKVPTPPFGCWEK